MQRGNVACRNTIRSLGVDARLAGVAGAFPEVDTADENTRRPAGVVIYTGGPESWLARDSARPGKYQQTVCVKK